MSGTGKLVVRVYTSQAEIPVEGATVVVTRLAPDGKQELLSLQVTDSSGLVRTISIPTPRPGESTSPDGSTPFTLCSIWAEHPGFAMLQVEGVQIFPGVRTLQEMELIPLGRGESSLQQRGVREITPQGL